MSLENIIASGKPVIDRLVYDLIGGGKKENQRKILSDNSDDNLKSTKGSDVFRAFEGGHITPEEYFTFKKNELWVDTTTQKFFEWYLEDYHMLNVPEGELFNPTPVEVNILNEQYSNIDDFDTRIEGSWIDEKELMLKYLPKLDLVEDLMKPILESNPGLDTKNTEVLDAILQKELDSNRLDGYAISLIKREWPELDSRKDIAEQYLTHLNKEIKNLKIKIPGEGLFSKIRNHLNDHKGLYGILGGVAIAGIAGGMAINHLATMDRPVYNSWDNLTGGDSSYVEDTLTTENNPLEDWIGGFTRDTTYTLENTINTEDQIVNNSAVDDESIVDYSQDTTDEFVSVAPEIYTVQSGDNLTNIARNYIKENNLDLSLSETIANIVATNGISDPNLIQIGDQLTIDFSNLSGSETNIVEETSTTYNSWETNWDRYDLSKSGVPFNSWELQGTFGGTPYEIVEDSLRNIGEDVSLEKILSITNPGWEKSSELWQEAINLFNIQEEVETYQSTEDVSLQEEIESLHYSPDFTRNCEFIEINLNQRLNNLESIWAEIDINQTYNVGGIQMDEIEWNSQMDEFEELIDQYELAVDSIIPAEEMLYRQQIQNLSELDLNQEVSFADTVGTLLDTLIQETYIPLENIPMGEIDFQNLEFGIEEYPEVIPYNFQKIDFPQSPLFESYDFTINLQEIEGILPESNIVGDTLAPENVNYGFDNMFNYESNSGLSEIVWDEQLTSSNHQEIILAGSQSSGSGGIGESQQQPVVAETNLNIGFVESRDNFYNSGIDAISIYQVADKDIRIQVNPFIDGFSISDYSLVLGNSDLEEVSRISNLNGPLEVRFSDFDGNNTINPGDQYVMVLKGVLRDNQGFSTGSLSEGINITSEWIELGDYSGIDTRLDE